MTSVTGVSSKTTCQTVEPMQTIDTSHVPTEQFEALEKAALQISPEILEVVQSLTYSRRNGAEVGIVDAATMFTPREAAERLGMSRTHLYKLLDRGELAYDNVGRDRRIPYAELVKFELQRQHDRRELAERFARQHQTRAGAVNELADLL